MLFLAGVLTAGHACALAESRVRTEETSQLFSSVRLAVGTRCLCPCFFCYLFFKIVRDCDVILQRVMRTGSYGVDLSRFLKTRSTELTVEFMHNHSDTRALQVGKDSENTHDCLAYLTVTPFAL